ncbi:hypothetical protein J2S00_003820 [Caldalkalibacillus uzonensis]|uniref:Uncharacterized protein n=1 Tax=Caldalkalibacillus uzonensis TaxID=353224 RepID=A0ABU0CXW1_9BACI|nr:hypothetical protein [Caldalkalibacillus uzonensis]
MPRWCQRKFRLFTRTDEANIRSIGRAPTVRCFCHICRYWNQEGRVAWITETRYFVDTVLPKAGIDKDKVPFTFASPYNCDTSFKNEDTV